MFATSATDDTVRIWNANNWEQTYQFELPGLEWYALDFHPKDNFLVGGFIDGNIRFFNTKDRKNLGKVKVSNSKITSITFSIRGQCLLIGDITG